MSNNNISQMSREDNYYNKVSALIKTAMTKNGYTQRHVIDLCRDECDVYIAQSTLSKILNPKGKGHMSLIFVAAICKVLDIDINKIFSMQKIDYADVLLKSQTHDKRASDIHGETLITNPNHIAFRGYIDREFDVYFYSTISSEHRILEGTLSLRNVENEYCEVKLKIVTGENRIKEYIGRMVISLQQQACYCVVSSEHLAEIGTIFFHHRFFSEEGLKVRIAVAATISAGDSRRPVIHRLIISEQGVITEEDKKFLASQLLLNDSQIRITENEFLKLAEDESVKGLFNSIRKTVRKEERVLTFEESDILNLSGFSYSEKIETLSLIRLNSQAYKYNKIGSKCDETVYRHLFKHDD